jgi:hypothetical protein
MYSEMLAGIVQRAPALPHCSSYASRARNAVRVTYPPPPSSTRACPLLSLHRVPDVQNAVPLLIRFGCGLCVLLRLALCASNAGENGTGLGFRMPALENLKPDNGLILS